MLKQQAQTRIAAVAGERGESNPLPRCYCGEAAVLEVSLSGGTRYFCKVHEAEGEALFQKSGRS
jgi:hypothetical protein